MIAQLLVENSLEGEQSWIAKLTAAAILFK